jgi:hypothetical protein
MLWLFLRESAEITDDARLLALFAEYKRRYLDPYPGNLWRHLFDAGAGAPVLARELKELPDYNLYFVFGATCDATLAGEEIVQRQNRHDFCEDHHRFAPACVTHQLMGARLAQQRGCLESDVAQKLVSALQEKIVTQLTWDPRVVDVYLQRVLMLAESGAVERIKPVWLQRVLDAQLPDGGWDNFHPLFPVSTGHYFGMSHIPAVRERKSNFHTTVQGVYLMSLWQVRQHSLAAAGSRLQQHGEK